MTMGQIMRIGAQDTEPLQAKIFISHPGEIVKACAEGAYRHGLAKLDPSLPQIEEQVAAMSADQVLSHFELPVEALPEGFSGVGSASSGWYLFEVIYLLNDQRGWSRERIAEWLDEITKAGHIPMIEIDVSISNIEALSGDSLPQERIEVSTPQISKAHE